MDANLAEDAAEDCEAGDGGLSGLLGSSPDRNLESDRIFESALAELA